MCQGGVWLPSTGTRSTLKERIGVGVEELSVTGGEGHLSVPAAPVEQPEQGEQPRPGAVALVHGVGIESSVFAKLLVESGDGVVLGEHRVVGHQPLVLGIQQEHQPQQGGEQTPVDVLRLLAGDLRE